MASDSCPQAVVNQKGGSIENSLEKLHDSQSSCASADVLKVLKNSGDRLSERSCKFGQKNLQFTIRKTTN